MQLTVKIVIDVDPRLLAVRPIPDIHIAILRPLLRHVCYADEIERARLFIESDSGWKPYNPEGALHGTTRRDGR